MEFVLRINIEDVKKLAQQFVIPGITDEEAESIIVQIAENPEIVKVFEQSIVNEINDYIHSKQVDVEAEEYRTFKRCAN